MLPGLPAFQIHSAATIEGQTSATERARSGPRLPARLDKCTSSKLAYVLQ